jgi:hypothetical protein
MSVTITKQARIRLLKRGKLKADDSEQVLVEFSGVGRVSGYIDASSMVGGDVITVRQYMKLNAASTYKEYAAEQYIGPLASPIIYITPKETDCCIKVTLRQTSGICKSFEYNFILEV